MPDSGGASLRLHCVCGQKMKLSESMCGLPGKCTSCRQKIRLPRVDQWPDDGTDIYLDDHPEFLREGKGRESDLPESSALQRDDDPTPVTELDRSDGAESSQQHMAGSVPLDSMTSMQTLTSLQLRIERKIQIIDLTDKDNVEGRAEWKGRLTRVRRLRIALDEQIHQSLMEVAIALTTTQENIADLQLSARVDEIPFDIFQEQVYELRLRRDHLERQQLNLRGWLATVGPSAVGGYRDVTIDELPKDGFDLSLQMEPDYVDSLLNVHADGLKQAFALRAKAEQKIEEIKNIRDSSKPEARARLKDPYALAKASHAIAEMQIGYFQQRLTVLIQDYESDTETLDAHIATARDQLSMDQLERSDYDRLKSAARHTKLDLNKGCSVARRLLLTKAAHEVPEPKGSFIKRISKSDSSQKQGGIARATNTVPGLRPLVVVIVFLCICLSIAILLIGVGGDRGAPTSLLEVESTESPALQETATIPPPTPEPAPVVPDEVTEKKPVVEVPVVPASETLEGDDLEAEKPPVPTAKLKGVITGSQGNVQFTLEVIIDPLAGGTSFRVRMREEIMNGWQLVDYDSRGILTLRRGEETLLLRRGETVELPALAEPLAE